MGRLLTSALILLLGAAAFAGTPDPVIIGTHNFGTTYYRDRDNALRGLEHDLGHAFGQYADVDIDFRVYDGIPDLLRALETGMVHIAAAGLTRLATRDARFLVGPAYQQVTQRLFCTRNVLHPSVAKLPQLEVQVVANSAYVQTLHTLRQKHPKLDWSTADSMHSIFERLRQRAVDCTLVDSNILSIYQRFFPRLQAVTDVGPTEDLVWYVHAGAPQVHKQVVAFFNDAQRRGLLARLLNTYYGHLDDHDPYDVRMFRKRITSRLPRYRALFERYAEVAGVGWRLLAAMSYQESHWDPQATSRTGVRGLMMLTQATASDLGIKNRTDPQASVHGGSRYLAQLVKRLPSYIRMPDRLYMALAAYNVGYGHLSDARMVAVRTGHNPNTWHGVKSSLPKLTSKKYYRYTPHGYARGFEPVRYVENIRNYHELLLGTLPKRVE